MLEKVYNYVKENRILESGNSVILGVSGGADSVCLLVVMKELAEKMNLQLTAVHINHCLRGEEAEEDMRYVVKLCKEMDVECYVYKEDIASLAEEMRCSTEEAGRFYRYKKFRETAEKVGADKIAVAHNMNDNSETFLLNLFRGTGIKGLCGIPVKRDNIIRPLLCLNRKEIEKFLNSRGIKYRIDSSNLTDEYTRNKIRRKILPYATVEINRHTVENINRVSKSLGEIDDFLEEQTIAAFNEIAVQGEDKIFLKENIWNNYHNVIKKRVVRTCVFIIAGRLKDITETHIELILDLWNHESGKSIDLPYGVLAVRTYGGVEIKKACEIVKPEASEINLDDISEIPVTINTGFGKFEISYDMPEDYNKIEDLLYTKWFDCGKINTNLQVRTRMEGDWLEINDNGQRKKLKSFFIDMKIPKEERDNIPLVADGNHILWIVGYRISSGYKVSAGTNKCIKIKYEGGKDEG